MILVDTGFYSGSKAKGNLLCLLAIAF
ncbi:hypothetical protein SBDP2_1240002 [Syntrophobacter sp. SbD2]|nr:hypothetical protein SBDP2_1240002 [Syntrophobacter sp. SbD2]